MNNPILKLRRKEQGERRKGFCRKREIVSRFLCVPFSFLLVPFILSAATAQDAPTLLSQMQNAEKLAKYAATQTITRNGKREVARVFRDGLKRRMEWLEPAFRKGDILVDDGRVEWLYHKRENSATQTQSNPRAPRFSAESAPKAQNFAGRSAYFLAGRAGRGVWIDKQFKIWLGARGQNGQTTLSSLKFGAVGADKFKFQTPSGAKILKLNGTRYANLGAAKRAARWILAPTDLPAGYALESVVAGRNEAWLRYFDGKNRFSLFQQKAEAGTVTPVEQNGGWFWKSNGIRFFATGAPDSSVQAMATSLK